MAYFIYLFSPDTYESFSKSDRTISGFRERHKGIASNIKPGDKFVCYITKLSRWFGILEIKSKSFIDNKQVFYAEDDPFIVRFKVEPIVLLPLNNAIPIHDDLCWKYLSFTKDLSKKSIGWTGKVRGSLVRLSDEDGSYLESILLKQTMTPKEYPINEDELKKIKLTTVKTQDSKKISVTIPEDELEETSNKSHHPRESIKIQSLIAEIGERMDLKIWIPRSDKERVLNLWKPKDGYLLDELPLNFDETTIRTIENIDVLWIKRKTIVRAFEVEHSTSIYSGILRMADLMALQPNLNIKAHIVAPLERKDKVMSEISRPVFTLLEKGPLKESCSFISYDSIIELSNERNLQYLKEDVLDKYSEYAEDDEI